MKRPFILTFLSVICVFHSLTSLTAAPGTVNSFVKITDNTNGLGTLLDSGNFGQSCTTLGDLNGDNVPDLAVGAFQDNTGGSKRGAVYILFMKADGTVQSQRKIAHNTGGLGSLTDIDKFGISCTALGDLNGDGIPDLAVGASGDDTGGSARGAVYILFLNRNGTVKSQSKVAHNTGGLGTLENSDTFGVSIASLGDLDGDGNPEIAVGAEGDASGVSSFGAIHILFLATDGTVKSTNKITNGMSGFTLPADLFFFGTTCNAIGDLNRDGFPDLAVGAVGNSGTGDGRESVEILFLDASGDVLSQTTIGHNTSGFGSIEPNDFFGASMCPLGDLNGDGVLDLAIGASGDATGGSNDGALYVLFMNENGTVKSSLKITDNLNGFGTLIAEGFGISCSLLGDIDGDTIPEVAVGASLDDTGGDQRGALYILSLGDPPITVTTAADEFDTPSGANLSLREAIRDAGDTGEFRDIRFNPSLTGQTITLGSELAIDGSSVRISGQDLPDGITISGNFASRVFNITNGSTVTLECLTLVDGSTNVGGGISNSSSTLFLRDVTIANCIASIFGGGISNNSVLTIERCTFYFNTATNGGAGIFNTGFMKAWNSTFALNETTGGNGGALFDSAGVTTLISFTTFLGNRASSAGEGIHAANGIVQLTNCIRTTEFDDLNQAGSGLIITGSSTEAPLLDFLPPGYYGGKTPTSPLRPDTAAKNTGTFLPLPTTDQNGQPRNRNGGTDPGAAEALESADNQPDNLIGEKPSKQKGNNLYNASGAGQNVKVKLKGSKKFKTFMTVQNDGIIPDTITLRSNQPNKRTLKLKVLQLGGGNVTAALLTGLSLPDLAPGKSVSFKADYKRKSKTRKASGKLNFTSTSSLFGISDTVLAKIESISE